MTVKSESVIRGTRLPFSFFKDVFNPIAPEPPVTARSDHVISTPRDVISFNGQGQLFPLTCAE